MLRQYTWVLGLTLSLGSIAIGCEGGPPAGGTVKSSAPALSGSARGPSTETARPPSAPTTSAAAAAPKPKKDVVCSKDPVVTFTDPIFEKAARFQLQKPEGPIQRADLKRIKTLDLSQAPSNDELDPCLFRETTGVKGLYLAPGKLDDISPLRGLTNVESLRLAATRVKDLSPIAGMIKLDRLDLGRTPVSDLSALSNLVNLTELQIDETEVSDLSPLSKLKKLKVLLMKRTRVSDVSPLRDLKELKQLYIEGSLVKDVSALSGIQGLKIHEGK